MVYFVFIDLYRFEFIMFCYSHNIDQPFDILFKFYRAGVSLIMEINLMDVDRYVKS